MSDKPIIFSAPMVRALLAGRKTQTRRVLKPQPEFRGGCGDWHDAEEWGWETEDGDQLSVLDIAPNGYHRGDRLWVREACRAEELSRPPLKRPATKAEKKKLGRTHIAVLDELDGADGIRYLADDFWAKIENTPSAAERWIDLFNYRGRAENVIGHNVSPIHMPRWASRLTLIVTDVRVQRVQEISEADAVAEGIEQDPATMAFWGADGQGVGGATTLWAHASMAFRDLWNSIHGPKAWDANPWVCAISFTVTPQNIDQIGGKA